MFGNSLGSFHNDVLSAQPTDEEGKTRLVEEIKNRAKGSLTSKNYPEAIQLYTKAIELRPLDAILFANRSMCHLQMSHPTEALSDAEQSLQLDITYAKAYFRKGSALVALKNYAEAKEAFREGLNLAPGDNSFITQLDKLSKLSTTPSTATQSPPVSTQQFPVKQAASAPKETETESVRAAEPTKFRGYKKTSDGRTTTFFNNELDDQTRELIGDIAPKKIDVAQVAQEVPNSGESVWNKAGTWEERVHTPWATSRLIELLHNVSISIPSDQSGGGRLFLKNASLTGDAQVTMARGKVKHIYDFSATVDWVLNMESVEDAGGSFAIEDISGDRDYEIQSTVTRKGDTESSKIVTQLVKSTTQGLHLAITTALLQFHEEFQQK